MEGGEDMIVEPAPEALDEFRAVAAQLRHPAGKELLPRFDNVRAILRLAIQVGDHEGFDANILEAGVNEKPPALRPDLDILIEMREEFRDLVIGPLDRVAARLAQAMGVLFVGDVDAPARLADAVELLEDEPG